MSSFGDIEIVCNAILSFGKIFYSVIVEVGSKEINGGAFPTTIT